MTAGAISGLSTLAGLTNVVNGQQNGAGATDFSDMLKASTEKQDSIKDVHTVKGSEKNRESEKKLGTGLGEGKTEARNGEIENKADNVKTKGETEKVDDTDISDEITEEVMAAAAQAVMTVADILEVPVEVVSEAIDNLGMSELDILDETKLQDIALEITGTEDPLELMTDESLYADVKAVSEAVGAIVDELDIPKEEVGDTISKIIESSANEEISAQNIRIDATVAKKDETKNDANESGQENAPQFSWTESVVDGIKNAATSTTETDTTYSTDMEQIYQQVSDSLKLNMTEDVTEMEINLHPASLGNVKIQIAAKDGVITANFTTQNEAVKAALETQIIQLKENMDEQGIKVEAIEVSVAAHAFDENLSKEGERSGASEESENRRKRRSINLNEIDENDDNIIVEDEIRIAREMMMHNGTTVDYMA